MIRRISLLTVGIALALVASADVQPGAQGTVYRDKVALHDKPAVTGKVLTTLQRSAPVAVDQQNGLWFQIHTNDNKAGYVRINEVRLTSTKPAGGSDNMAALVRGHGSGKVSETAGVRGLEESQLKAANFDATQLAMMEANRADVGAGNSYARSKHLSATSYPYPDETKGAQKPGSENQPQREEPAEMPPEVASRNPFAKLGGAFKGMKKSGMPMGDLMDAALSPEEQQDELALGPQIAGRVLGAAPLYNDPAAQHRVNAIGRWVASQTYRPDYPWTFAIIDLDEYNAFAAPGGYVFMTRGLYDVLQSDDEVAAVLAHEMSHVVQRDQYNVVRKQKRAKIGTDIASGMLVDRVGNSGGVGGMLSKTAASYLAKFGATLVLTHFDQAVEYRADDAAEVYLVRAGYNPLAMYAVLQKLAGVSTSSKRLSTLTKSHPSASARLDNLDKQGLTAMATYTDRKYVN